MMKIYSSFYTLMLILLFSGLSINLSAQDNASEKNNTNTEGQVPDLIKIRKDIAKINDLLKDVLYQKADIMVFQNYLLTDSEIYAMDEDISKKDTENSRNAYGDFYDLMKNGFNRYISSDIGRVSKITYLRSTTSKYFDYDVIHLTYRVDLTGNVPSQETFNVNIWDQKDNPKILFTSLKN